MKEGEILIAEVTKRSILGFDGEHAFRVTYCSFDREKLIEHLQTCYKTTFVKDVNDVFPYFTDGGFKFNWTDDCWLYEATAIPHKII